MTRAPFLAVAPIALLAACGSSADPEAVLETVRATEQAQIQAMTTRDLRGAAAADGEAIAATLDA